MTFRRAIYILRPTDPNTKAELTPDEVLDYIKDDIIAMVERSGSWEAGNMQDVFCAHGWFNHGCRRDVL